MITTCPKCNSTDIYNINDKAIICQICGYHEYLEPKELVCSRSKIHYHDFNASILVGKLCSDDYYERVFLCTDCGSINPLGYKTYWGGYTGVGLTPRPEVGKERFNGTHIDDFDFDRRWCFEPKGLDLNRDDTLTLGIENGDLPSLYQLNNLFENLKKHDKHLRKLRLATQGVSNALSSYDYDRKHYEPTDNFLVVDYWYEEPMVIVETKNERYGSRKIKACPKCGTENSHTHDSLRGKQRKGYKGTTRIICTKCGTLLLNIKSKDESSKIITKARIEEFLDAPIFLKQDTIFDTIIVGYEDSLDIFEFIGRDKNWQLKYQPRDLSQENVDKLNFLLIQLQKYGYNIKD